MTLLALLLVILSFQTTAEAQSVAPVIDLPEPGLDDPVAYEGFRTRFYRDAEGNAIQVYLDQRTGRVANVWGDAFNESLSFTVRDASGEPAAVRWGSKQAQVGTARGARSLTYDLIAEGGPMEIGHFNLGTMRWERDVQYFKHNLEPFTAGPFPIPQLAEMTERLERLPRAERQRHLAALRARNVQELRGRLQAALTLRPARGNWVLRAHQPSFDGRNYLMLELRGDQRNSTAELVGRMLRVRPRGSEPVRMTVRIESDAPTLTPLTRQEIFNPEFFAFYERVRTDSVADPLRFRRLERQVRSFELLSYQEKLMAGLPNFATYFGRDMLMTALMMKPVWADGMAEHVIGSVLRRLSPTGEVSHEEALGEQAIREHAEIYTRLLDESARLREEGRAHAADSALAGARQLLTNIGVVRENYHMLDDDFQFPVLVARYLADPDLPAERKRAYLLGAAREGDPETRLSALLRNLVYVARRAEPYAREPNAANLIDFPRMTPEQFFPGSWRDSNAGYGNGRFAMDVNAVWVPSALDAVAQILPALERLGFSLAELETRVPELPGSTLASYARDPAALRRAAERWGAATRHFLVDLTSERAREQVLTRLQRFPENERRFWTQRLEAIPRDRMAVDFLAVSLDTVARPIAVMNTDAAMRLLLRDPPREVVLRDVHTFVLPYPVGLFVPRLGPLAANDAYASPYVWERFRADPYHSPSVVWGREVNLIILALARQLRLADSAGDAFANELRDALRRVVEAVDASGLRYTELWTYRIEGDRLIP
ncbi:MAG TPA: hypothetical protein VGR27_09820, partial [Longimicrobiaceae bacterium]|nr:hypothetical protein [Longimicrobiaceae bacterium]